MRTFSHFKLKLVPRVDGWPDVQIPVMSVGPYSYAEWVMAILVTSHS